MKKKLIIAICILLSPVLIYAAGVGISAWTALTGDIADGDLLGITDVSDTTQSTDGSSKKITFTQVLAYLQSTFYTEAETDTALSLKADASDLANQTAFEAAFFPLPSGSVPDGSTIGDVLTWGGASWGAGTAPWYESGDSPTFGTITAGASGFTVDDDGDVAGKSFSVAQNSTGPQVMTLLEDSDNGTNYVGVASPSSNANDLILLLPTSDPTTGQVLTCAAPTSVTFSDGVARDASVCSWADNNGGLANMVEDTTPQLGGDLDIQTNSIEGVDATEFGYLDGVTSDIQTQLSGKAGEIASGTATLGTSAIADGACATVVTVSATGVATTDTIVWSFNADPSATTGYNPTGDLVYIVDYPTANNVNFKVCNKSGSSITPGAITLNWRVDR